FRKTAFRSDRASDIARPSGERPGAGRPGISYQAQVFTCVDAVNCPIYRLCHLHKNISPALLASLNDIALESLKLAGTRVYNRALTNQRDESCDSQFGELFH